MEEKIYELYCEIKKELSNYSEVQNILGDESPYVNRLCAKIMGMEKAFEIIAGEPYIVYMRKLYEKASA